MEDRVKFLGNPHHLFRVQIERMQAEVEQVRDMNVNMYDPSLGREWKWYGLS